MYNWSRKFPSLSCKTFSVPLRDILHSLCSKRLFFVTQVKYLSDLINRFRIWLQIQNVIVAAWLHLIQKVFITFHDQQQQSEYAKTIDALTVLCKLYITYSFLSSSVGSNSNTINFDFFELRSTIKPMFLHQNWTLNPFKPLEKVGWTRKTKRWTHWTHVYLLKPYQAMSC